MEKNFGWGNIRKNPIKHLRISFIQVHTLYDHNNFSLSPEVHIPLQRWYELFSCANWTWFLFELHWTNQNFCTDFYHCASYGSLSSGRNWLLIWKSWNLRDDSQMGELRCKHWRKDFSQVLFSHYLIHYKLNELSYKNYCSSRLGPSGFATPGEFLLSKKLTFLKKKCS